MDQPPTDIEGRVGAGASASQAGNGRVVLSLRCLL